MATNDIWMNSDLSEKYVFNWLMLLLFMAEDEGRYYNGDLGTGKNGMYWMIDIGTVTYETDDENFKAALLSYEDRYDLIIDLDLL